MYVYHFEGVSNYLLVSQNEMYDLNDIWNKLNLVCSLFITMFVQHSDKVHQNMCSFR